MTNLETWRYNYVPDDGARQLLYAERRGFSIDATTYGTPAFTGGPAGGTVAIHADNSVDRGNVPLDAYAAFAQPASPLTQSGTSAKMVHFPTSPYVRWTPHNLQTQSEAISGASAPWNSQDIMTNTANATTAPDGLVTADRVQCNGAGAALRANAITVVAGMTYTFSVYAKRDNIDWLELLLYDAISSDARAWFNLNTGAGGTLTGGSGAGFTGRTGAMVSVGSGWYRCSVTATVVTSTSLHAQIMPATADGNHAGTATNDGVYVWGGQTNRGSIPTPYLRTTSAARIGIPQGYDTAAAQYGMLVEPAATNLQSRSEEFDNGDWSVGSATVAANNTTAPDARTTADKVTANSGSATHNIYSTFPFTTTANTDYTLSVYIKSSTATFASLSGVDSTVSSRWYAATFNLSTGAVTQQTDGANGTIASASFVAIGDGWFRINVTGQHAGTQTAISIQVLNTGTPTHGGNSDVTWSAAGTEALWLWGAQGELGTVATSYIPTLGSTVTRAKDFPQATSFPTFSNTANTIYADFKARDLTSAAAAWQVYTFDEASAGTSDVQHWVNNAADYRYEIGGGSYTTAASIVINNREQTSLAYAASDMRASEQGALGISSASVTPPTGITQLTLGAWSDNSTQLNGFLYRLVQVPRRVSDGDLPTWRYNF